MIANKSFMLFPVFCIILLVKQASMAPASRCEPITTPLCKGVQYKKTVFPNILSHKNQGEAGLEVHQFHPLVKAKCSQYLKLFLCSVYIPMCSDEVSSPIPPCRSLCKAAKDGCLPLLHTFGFQWPEKLSCERYPEMGSGRRCVEKNALKRGSVGGGTSDSGSSNGGGKRNGGKEGQGTTNGRSGSKNTR